MSNQAATGLALNHIGQISLTVSNIERSLAFYRDILGIPHLFTAGDLAFLDCDGTRVMLDALPEARGQGTSILYFSVPDIHSACDALASHGVALDGAPHMIYRHPDGTEEWMAFFPDPDGNTMAFMSAVKP